MPAYVRNSRLDILAWNNAVADLFVDYAALPPRERNTLRLMFLYEPYRTLILDWEMVARGTLATFRAALAHGRGTKRRSTGSSKNSKTPARSFVPGGRMSTSEGSTRAANAFGTREWDSSTSSTSR